MLQWEGTNIDCGGYFGTSKESSCFAITILTQNFDVSTNIVDVIVRNVGMERSEVTKLK